MPITEIILLIVIGAVVLAVIVALARRWYITRGAGFIRALSQRPGSARYRPGIVRYDAGGLGWYSSRSVRLGPSRAIDREAILDVEHEDADLPVKVAAFFQGYAPVRVTLRVAHEDDMIMVMTRSSYNGLAAWRESAPPSFRADYYS